MYMDIFVFEAVATGVDNYRLVHQFSVDGADVVGLETVENNTFLHLLMASRGDTRPCRKL